MRGHTFAMKTGPPTTPRAKPRINPICVLPSECQTLRGVLKRNFRDAEIATFLEGSGRHRSKLRKRQRKRPLIRTFERTSHTNSNNTCRGGAVSPVKSRHVVHGRSTSHEMFCCKLHIRCRKCAGTQAHLDTARSTNSARKIGIHSIPTTTNARRVLVITDAGSDRQISGGSKSCACNGLVGRHIGYVRQAALRNVAGQLVDGLRDSAVLRDCVGKNLVSG